MHFHFVPFGSYNIKGPYESHLYKCSFSIIKGLSFTHLKASDVSIRPMHNYNHNQNLINSWPNNVNQMATGPPDHRRLPQDSLLPHIALPPCSFPFQPYWIATAPPVGQITPHQRPQLQRVVCFPPPRPYQDPIAHYPVHMHSPESIEIINIQSVHSPAPQNPVIPIVDTTTSRTSRARLRRQIEPQMCAICGKTVSRDLLRHMRTHEPISRFKCLYPRENCLHKSGYFNRQYDFKKHLLHGHFHFDDPNVKKYHSLREKLSFMGKCFCGREMTARDFLENHIMMKDEEGQFRCPDLRKKWDALGKPPDPDRSEK